MRYIYNLLLLIIISLVYPACKSNIQVKDEYQVISSEDLATAEENHLLIEDIEFIPLSTGDDHLIGKVCGVQYQNGKFYIFDNWINKSVTVFSENGNFQYKIDKTGRGPGEYAIITDFDVDSSGNVYLVDPQSRKLLCYSNEGKTFRNVEAHPSFSEFKFLDANSIITFLPFTEMGVFDCYGMINLSNQRYKSLLELRDEIDKNFYFHELSHIFRSKGNIYIYPRFSNIIYKVNSTTISPVLKFVEDAPLTEDEIKIILDDRQAYISNKDNILSVSGIYEADNVLYISYHKDHDSDFFYSLNSKTIGRINRVDDCELIGSSKIYGSTGDCFISIINSNSLDEDKVIGSCLPDSIKALLYQRDFSANPVIALFRLKEF